MALFVVSDMHLGESTLPSMFRDHDRPRGEPGGGKALDAAGLTRVQIEPMAVRRVMDKWVVLQHGHAWDPSCATATGGGETMTAVLHHAVIPFLRHVAPRSNVLI